MEEAMQVTFQRIAQQKEQKEQRDQRQTEPATPQKKRQSKKAALDSLRKGFDLTQNLLDSYTRLLPRILKGDSGAIDSFEKEFQEAIGLCPTTEDVFGMIGFRDGHFTEETDWDNMGTWLIHNRSQIQLSLDELQALATPKKKAGRPFGSKNKKRAVAEPDAEDPEEPDEDEAEEPPAKKQRTGKKTKSKNGKKEPEDEEEEKPVEQEDEEANRACSIPLIRKCEIVQKAKELMKTKSVTNVEKEVARLFPKEFATSRGKRGHKTGMLTKWIRTAFPLSLLLFSLHVTSS